MRARPQFLDELFDVSRVSPSRIDEALAAGCPQTVHWCDLQESGLTRKQLRQHVIANLPAAFRVTLKEVARREHGRFTWHSEPPRLSFAWAAYLDVFSELERMHTVTIECVAHLDRDSGFIEVDEQTRRLRVESDLPWLCSARFSLRESEVVAPALFHSEQREVVFADDIL